MIFSAVRSSEGLFFQLINIFFYFLALFLLENSAFSSFFSLKLFFFFFSNLFIKKKKKKKKKKHFKGGFHHVNTVVLEKIRRWILDCASDALEVSGNCNSRARLYYLMSDFDGFFSFIIVVVLLLFLLFLFQYSHHQNHHNHSHLMNQSIKKNKKQIASIKYHHDAYLRLVECLGPHDSRSLESLTQVNNWISFLLFFLRLY